MLVFFLFQRAPRGKLILLAISLAGIKVCSPDQKIRKSSCESSELHWTRDVQSPEQDTIAKPGVKKIYFLRIWSKYCLE
ncbi:hypothetical protein WA026_007248 [Henosepilachna vigintioctopunctata]|uniref:Secreted protein n=1 Tax=Henosepilachna vigintioctopunctata TaxID=420089 RepID=A0AAW1UVA1_9CUCU